MKFLYGLILGLVLAGAGHVMATDYTQIPTPNGMQLYGTDGSHTDVVGNMYFSTDKHGKRSSGYVSQPYGSPCP